jgi:hypothetical protein
VRNPRLFLVALALPGCLLSVSVGGCLSNNDQPPPGGEDAEVPEVDGASPPFDSTAPVDATLDTGADSTSNPIDSTVPTPDAAEIEAGADAASDAAEIEAGTDAAIIDSGPDVTAVDAGIDAAPPVDAGPPDAIATLATSQDEPWTIAVDSQNAYWANLGNGTVMQLSLGDGGLTVLATTGSFEANGIAVSADAVYWTDFNAGAVESIPIGGGTATTIAQLENEPQLMAIDSNNVYWAVDNGGQLDAGYVMAAPLDGGTPFTVTAGGNPDGVAVWGNTVAYTNDTYPGGSITSVTVDGGNALSVLTGLTYPTAIVEQAGYYYFLAQDDGGVSSPRSVWAVSVTGTSGQLLYQSTAAARIAVDANHVYWTDGTLGEIFEANLLPGDGAAPIVVASGQSGPTGIAVGGGYVYWTNNGDGTVRRAPIQ